MSVPFVDLRGHDAGIAAEVGAAIARTIDEARFILGPAVESFERRFASFLDVRHCVGVNSGTSALHLALLACGVGPGDEVITTPLSWISTSWAISYLGATPVFVDVDPRTYNIGAEQVEPAITGRTRAILPVHLYGQSAEMPPLVDLAHRRGLALVEDAAQAHGARYGGRRVGTFGSVGCFSFYPGKNLGAYGEAGALVTDDDEIARRARLLRDHAQSARHHHVEIGYNARMEGIQGAVLDIKIKYLDGWNARRRGHAARYRDLLAGTEGIILPGCPHAEGHVWHLYVILADAVDRDELRRELASRGVETGVHYPQLIPYQPAYAHLGYRPGAFPVAEGVARRCTSLPMYPGLTEEQILLTSSAVRESLETLGTRRKGRVWI